ncbi:hypothetical protein RJ55_05796 [Drechmeria coniospora]|nr:hypothetical protein RJ55_05796 [Drechmeria coniospora]
MVQGPGCLACTYRFSGSGAREATDVMVLSRYTHMQLWNIMAAAAPAMLPGIRFDPREPVPPRFAHLVQHLPNGELVDDAGDFNRLRFAARDRDFPGVGGGHGPNLAPANPDLHRPAPQHRFQRFVEPDIRPIEPEAPQAQHGFLPPLSSSIKVQVVHDTAKFTVTHLFWNQSNGIDQGTYQFPLPLDATVTDFSCRVGAHKIIRGRVKAKEDARREFEHAARQGRPGGLAEQQTAEIFTINLANIGPNTKMRAEISFMCLLKHRITNNREVFTLTVPTFIAPRYGDVPQGVEVGTRNNHFMNFELDVLTAHELIAINSDTHSILFERGAGQRACQTWEDFVMRRDNADINLKTGIVQLEQARTSLDRDMVIFITTAMAENTETPLACLEVHPDFEHHRALMLTLPSDYLLTGEGFAHDGEIVFVADRSRSMHDKIESLRSAMMFFINGIPENRPFNIWSFGGYCESMWPRSKGLNEETRREAIHYVRHHFAANMGGTDILPALKQIYESRGGYHTMDVVVLTDGEIWDPQETINFVKDTRLRSEGMFRCFSLGIGYAVSHELVEGLAKAGGGYAEVISDAHGGGWEDRVVAVLKAAMTGHVGNVQMQIEWHRPEGSEMVPPPKFKQSPADVSAISPFVRNRVFLLFDSDMQSLGLHAIVLSIRGPQGVVTTKRILPKRLLQPDATLHKLAVRAILGDLERGESWLHRFQQQNRSGAEEAVVRQEAIALGCKWSLVSKWTSLYAVEDEAADAMEDIDFQIQLGDDEDDHRDALLQPRGMPNMNIGLIPQGDNAAQGVESASESDDADSETGTEIGSILPSDDDEGSGSQDTGNGPNG